jgi:protease-4
VARLERALRDPRIRGVLLRPRGSGMGMAYAQEVRLLISQLEDAGKHVVCYLEDATGSELYACAGASSIVGDPAGGIRLYGPSMEIQHYAGLLRELDIRADFIRIGRFKSAIEELQDDHMSTGAREARETIMDELHGRFVHDVARDLSLDEVQAAEVIAAGPYVAPDAVEAGLVDHLADQAELGEILGEVYGGSFPRERSEPDEIDRRFGREARVGVVVIDGEMMDGENLDIPLLEIHTTGGRTAVEAIDALAGDASVSAIVIRLDTPGGSVLAADQIWRAIQRARERVPVIASMGAIAASGGYYVASGCDEIWADPSTLTGSIGVWYGKVDFEPLATRFGVVTEEISRTPHANAETLFAPFTPEERALLADAVRHWYRTFLRRVAAGRGMTMTEVHAIAQGRVWTGDHALELGLVDHLGGFQSALMRARGLGGLPGDAPFEVLPRRPSSLLDYVLGGIGIGEAGDAPVASDPTGLTTALSSVAPEVLSALRFAVLLRGYESSTPMALWPVDPHVVP